MRLTQAFVWKLRQFQYSAAHPWATPYLRETEPNYWNHQQQSSRRDQRWNGLRKSGQVGQYLLEEAIRGGERSSFRAMCIQPNGIVAKQVTRRVAHERWIEKENSFCWLPGFSRRISKRERHRFMLRGGNSSPAISNGSQSRRILTHTFRYNFTLHV